MSQNVINIFQSLSLLAILYCMHVIQKRVTNTFQFTQKLADWQRQDQERILQLLNRTQDQINFLDTSLSEMAEKIDGIL